MSALSGWRWRRRLSRLSIEHRSDFVLPDGVEGYVHIEHVLLRPEGFYVLDVFEGKGQLIAGERLKEWALVGKRRFAFPNPLESLQRKVTAIRLVAGGVSVSGLVVLADGVAVPRGKPPSVAVASELQERLPPLPAHAAVQPAYAEAWSRVSAVRSQSQADC